MPDPNLRAADSDRAAVAAQLGRHLSDGRLTLDEYDERVAKAYAARTYGELDELTADLPRATPAPQPAAAAQRAPGACGGARTPGGVRAAWTGWLTVALVVTSIWAFSALASGLHPFWPMWVVGPWGAVLLARTIGGRGYSGPGRRRRGW